MGHCNTQTTINKVNERTSAKSNPKQNLRNKLEFEIYEANTTKQKNETSHRTPRDRFKK